MGNNVQQAIELITKILKNKYGEQIPLQWWRTKDDAYDEELHSEAKKYIPIVARAIKVFGHETVVAAIENFKVNNIDNIGAFMLLCKNSSKKPFVKKASPKKMTMWELINEE